MGEFEDVWEDEIEDEEISEGAEDGIVSSAYFCSTFDFSSRNGHGWGDACDRGIG